MPTNEGFDASKRDFLKLTGLLGASHVAAETDSAIKVAQLGVAGMAVIGRWINQVRERNALESRFGVKLQNTVERRLWIEQWLRPSGLDVPTTWDMGRIKLMRDSLGMLPEHLLRDPDYDEPLNLLLSHENRCCSNPEYFMDTIAVDYRAFRPDAPITAKCIAAHESTHLYFKRSRLMYSDLDEKLEQLLGQDRPHFALRLLNNLGQEGVQADQIVDIIKRKGTIEDAHLSPEEEDKFRFLTSLFWGLRDPNEFIATMSESYILGSEYFMRWTSHYFSLPVAQRLYDYQKKTVFKGREY